MKSRFSNISPIKIKLIIRGHLDSESPFSWFPKDIVRHIIKYFIYDTDNDFPTIDKSKINWKKFEYPIKSFFAGEGSWDSKFIGMTTADNLWNEPLNTDLFEKVFLFQQGKCDEESWIFLIKHRNGYFVYFNASCDYTGFDCRGGGTIICGTDFDHIWTMEMTNDSRNLFLKQTSLYHLDPDFDYQKIEIVDQRKKLINLTEVNFDEQCDDDSISESE